MTAPSRNITRSKTPKNSKTAKPEVKGNKSILSFFKKAEQSLFLDGPCASVTDADSSEPSLVPEDDIDQDDDVSRFNEVDKPSKRRKMENLEAGCVSQTQKGNAVAEGAGPAEPHTTKAIRSKKAAAGFLLEDSDSEAQDDIEPAPRATTTSVDLKPVSGIIGRSNENSALIKAIYSEADAEYRPKLGEHRETLGPGLDVGNVEGDNFGAVQREHPPDLDQSFQRKGSLEGGGDDAEELCPICSGNLTGATSEEATRHVNGCLDGRPTPLPSKPVSSKPVSTAQCTSPVPAAPAPPAMVLGSVKSAFSKLMASSAEAAAWTAAASKGKTPRAEAAGDESRKKRKCPFYKIMPGFDITVDAFRYGAVDGCAAYFLSHFHSDHYIGLSTSWCHGPIYCSRVTSALVQQQLRVDPQWLVPLDMETWTEVPNTGGARVLLIDANHCPGSVLFLFEKTANERGRKKTTRVLHCGDFRASPHHLLHPELRPNEDDGVLSLSKSGRKRIDACYLDTTYLNPKYSFPRQEDVIRACAKLCLLLHKNPHHETPWLLKQTQTNDLRSFMTVNPKNEDTSMTPESPSLPCRTNPINPFTVASRTAKPLTPAVESPISYPPERLLVVCGSYSIGKERIFLAVAEALDTKIFASAGKLRVYAKLADAHPDLAARLTTDPRAAQVHVVPMSHLALDSLRDYLQQLRPAFGRVIGLRPTGWSYAAKTHNIAGQKGVKEPRADNDEHSDVVDSSGDDSEADAEAAETQAEAQAAAAMGSRLVPAAAARTTPSTVRTAALLHHATWRARFGLSSLKPGRGSTRDCMVFSVPYSEHSSFRELALFVLGLNIARVVPTVNVGSETSRARMAAWLDRWAAERARGGFVRPVFATNAGRAQARKMLAARTEGTLGSDKELQPGEDDYESDCEEVDQSEEEAAKIDELATKDQSQAIRLWDGANNGAWDVYW